MTYFAAPAKPRTQKKTKTPITQQDSFTKQLILRLVEKQKSVYPHEVSNIGQRSIEDSRRLLNELRQEGHLFESEGYYYTPGSATATPKEPEPEPLPVQREEKKVVSNRKIKMNEDSPYTSVEVLIPKGMLSALRAYAKQQLSSVELEGGALLSEIIRVYQVSNVIPTK